MSEADSSSYTGKRAVYRSRSVTKSDYNSSSSGTSSDRHRDSLEDDINKENKQKQQQIMHLRAQTPPHGRDPCLVSH
jgi:hypothetical protein